MYEEYEESLKKSSSSSTFRDRMDIIDIISRTIKKYKMDTDEDGLRKLDDFVKYGNPDVTTYIYQQFYDNKNIDKTYKSFSNKVYAGNYLGFQDIDSLNKFTNKDYYIIYQ